MKGSGFKIWGVPNFKGTCSGNIFGSIVGSTCFGKLPCKFPGSVSSRQDSLGFFVSFPLNPKIGTWLQNADEP